MLIAYVKCIQKLFQTKIGTKSLEKRTFSILGALEGVLTTQTALVFKQQKLKKVYCKRIPLTTFLCFELSSKASKFH